MNDLPLFDYKPLAFGTEHLTPAERESLLLSAESQEGRIFEFFCANLYSPFGASEVWKAVRKGEHEPITSIRRALTNLTTRTLKDKAGRKYRLYKLDETRKGIFGKQEHLFRLVRV